MHGNTLYFYLPLTAMETLLFGSKNSPPLHRPRQVVPFSQPIPSILPCLPSPSTHLCLFPAAQSPWLEFVWLFKLHFKSSTRQALIFMAALYVSEPSKLVVHVFFYCFLNPWLSNPSFVKTKSLFSSLLFWAGVKY